MDGEKSGGEVCGGGQICEDRETGKEYIADK